MSNKKFDVYLMGEYGVISHEVFDSEQELMEENGLVEIPNEDSFEVELDANTVLYVNKIHS